MINRILIRMKVVQMLYSYLLTRSDFKTLPEPESHSRDKRYAYSLYCDLLLLLIDASGFRIVNFEGRPRFEFIGTRGKYDVTSIAKALADDDEMKEIALRHKSFYDALRPISERLRAEVKESSIYKEYQRKKEAPEIQDEVTMWKTILHTILLRNEQLKALIHSNPDFTHVGYDLALNMLEETLNDYSTTRSSLVDANRGLAASLDKSYELYMSLLQLMVDLTDMRNRQLDEAKHKYLPSHDDLNPNMKFVENKFIELLRENPNFVAYKNETPVDWTDNDVMLRRLLDKIIESPAYNNYMESKETSFAADCELWIHLFKNVILESDELAEAMESMSVYWNDDLAIMGSFALKTIKSYAAAGGTQVRLSPKYKDEEDRRFGPMLFEAVIRNQDEYRALIDECLVGSTWDPERLAFMDIVILETAIAELIKFDSVPTLVTVNEYTEIANYYSTAKSGIFITGMLYSIISNLKNRKIIVKD
ncbi:transcription antitermination factor NusB [uncultured Muribaculum sp.]|uniref:transcription antitermination factor NusB n=1 Tax=uncultured Muribaculum sp. TaxID=1918613 RepID=UPI0025916251|nr:transcription antitermination factor NusB [uncultured Muribaculum sp.]